MSRTSMPTSSRTSRSTQRSSDSPTSTNPASSENMPAGQTAWRPSNTRSPPSWIRQITAGSMRGNSSCPASVNRDQPPRDTVVTVPSCAL
ncbi:Uncharacterised protein [Mycobacteroides abscessus subsp. abscessus]|nr:Uncharacterised protein [Mycobacteroides abscessus subsp. abscessus]